MSAAPQAERLLLEHESIRRSGSERLAVTDRRILHERVGVRGRRRCTELPRQGHHVVRTCWRTNPAVLVVACGMSLGAGLLATAAVVAGTLLGLNALPFSAFAFLLGAVGFLTLGYAKLAAVEIADAASGHTIEHLLPFGDLVEAEELATRLEALLAGADATDDPPVRMVVHAHEAPGPTA